MPKDDERKEMTQEELDAREEKFRTFFTTSVAQVPEEMTRRDDENEEKPKSLLGRLFRREKGEQPEGGTPEESRTGEIQLGGEEPEEPSDLELVLALEEEVAEPKPEQPKPAEPVSAPQPEPEKPQKPAEPIKAPEPPAPKPEKKPAEKQAAPRKKAVQYEPRTPQEQYEDREMQALKAVWCKASAAGGRASPTGEARRTGKKHPGSSGHCSETGRRKRAGCSAGEACRADARDGVCRRQGVEAPCGPGDAVLRQG